MSTQSAKQLQLHSTEVDTQALKLLQSIRLLNPGWKASNIAIRFPLQLAKAKAKGEETGNF